MIMYILGIYLYAKKVYFCLWLRIMVPKFPNSGDMRRIVSEGKPYFDVLCVCGVYAYMFVFTSVLPYIIYTTTNFPFPNIDTLIRRFFQSSWVF